MQVHEGARYRAPARAQHEFTEVTYERTGRGGRGGQRTQPTFGGACCGAVFGVALLVGATMALWWNEGNAVRAQQREN